MGQIISFINMKGGVAKTTLAVNVAYALALEHQKKVLLVDGDPQFNASTYVMTDDQYLEHVEDKNKRTILDIFAPRRHDNFSLLKGTKKAVKKGLISIQSCTFRAAEQDEGVLDLIPSTLALMEIETSQRGTENRLSTFLKPKTGAYPRFVSVIDSLIKLANASNIKRHLSSAHDERELPDAEPAPNHLFDLLRSKELFPSNTELADFAAKVLPNMTRKRFDKMSRADIAARIIEYLETLPTRTRGRLEDSMRSAMKESRPTRRGERQSFFSKWENIIKGIEL